MGLMELSVTSELVSSNSEKSVFFPPVLLPWYIAAAPLGKAGESLTAWVFGNVTGFPPMRHANSRGSVNNSNQLRGYDCLFL